MIRFVLNKCNGVFSLSDAALSMLPSDVDYCEYAHRGDEELLDVVETLGPNSNGRHADLVIVEIPNNATDYEISEYDGLETLTYVVRGKIHHV